MKPILYCFCSHPPFLFVKFYFKKNLYYDVAFLCPPHRLSLCVLEGMLGNEERPCKACLWKNYSSLMLCRCDGTWKALHVYFVSILNSHCCTEKLTKAHTYSIYWNSSEELDFLAKTIRSPTGGKVKVNSSFFKKIKNHVSRYSISWLSSLGSNDSNAQEGRTRHVKVASVWSS